MLGVSFVTTPAEAPVSIISSNTVLTSEENKTTVCSSSSDLFNNDESSVLATEYAKSDTAECLFVGCGGII